MATKKYIYLLSVIVAVGVVIFLSLYLHVRNETHKQIAAIEIGFGITADPNNSINQDQDINATDQTAILGPDLLTLDPELIIVNDTFDSNGIPVNTTVFRSADTPENQFQNYLSALVDNGWTIINQFTSPTLYSLYGIKNNNSEINITITPYTDTDTAIIYQSEISVSQSGR